MNRNNKIGNIYSKKLNLFFSAGECSGDLLAAELFSQIRKKNPEATGYGITGKNMRTAGIKTLFDSEELAVMGFKEVFNKLATLKKLQANLLSRFDKTPPDLAILVDYQEFHQNFGEQLKLREIPCILYVAPQVWAWRKGRLKTLKEKTDLILGILPFEKNIFDEHKIKYHFVGSDVFDRTNLLKRKKEQTTKHKVAFFPGSRVQELKNLLPIMIKIITKINHPKIKPIIHFKANFTQNKLTHILSPMGLYLKNNRLFHFSSSLTETSITCSFEPSLNLMKKVDFALITSGTACLECAFIGTPLAVIYKTSQVNYAIGKKFISVPYLSLPNLILNKPVIKEFIQNIDPFEVASHILNLVFDEKSKLKLQNDLTDLKQHFPENSSARAAEVVTNYLTQLSQ